MLNESACGDGAVWQGHPPRPPRCAGTALWLMPDVSAAASHKIGRFGTKAHIRERLQNDLYARSLVGGSKAM
jgi:hypothetical protein